MLCSQNNTFCFICLKHPTLYLRSSPSSVLLSTTVNLNPDPEHPSIVGCSIKSLLLTI